MRKVIRILLAILIVISPAILIGLSAGSLHYFYVGLLLETLVVAFMPWWGILLWSFIIWIVIEGDEK